MKASELRIGNFVEFSGRDFRVTTIDTDGFYGRYKHGNISAVAISWDEINPILLTEEWLLKFGFNKRYKSFARGDFTFIENSVMAYKLSIVDNMPKYVHQLQNLYFALTGEELTLKEEA